MSQNLCISAHRGMLLGLCALSALGATFVGLRSYAYGASNDVIPGVTTPLSAKTLATLDRVSRNFQMFAIDEALADVEHNLKGLEVSGEVSDYYALRVSQLKLMAAQGRFDEATANWIEWIAATPTELLTHSFTQFIVIGLGRHEDLQIALDFLETDESSGAAARLQVARLELDARSGEFTLLGSVDALRPIATLAYEHPISREILLGIYGLATPASPLSQTQIARNVAAAIGEERLEINFLLNWASLEHSDGFVSQADAVLKLAEPKIATLTDEVRWTWVKANVAYDQGRFQEARLLSDAVKQLSEGAILDTDFSFSQQTAILDDLIENGYKQAFGIPLTRQQTTAPTNPCDIVVDHDGHDGGGGGGSTNP